MRSIAASEANWAKRYTCQGTLELPQKRSAYHPPQGKGGGGGVAVLTNSFDPGFHVVPRSLESRNYP